MRTARGDFRIGGPPELPVLPSQAAEYAVSSREPTGTIIANLAVIRIYLPQLTA